MSYSTNQFTGQKDFKLLSHQWTIPNPKAKLILIHGFGEHAKRYEEEAVFFNQAGYTVHAYDHRGHGKSEGRMAYMERFEFLVKDLKTFIDEEVEANEPYYIYGHSMGGLAVVSYIINYYKKDTNLKGVLLTGPLLMASKDTAPLLQKLSGVVGSLLPTVKTVKLDANKISRNPDVVKAYNEDPLVFSEGIYARTAAEMLKSTKNIQAQFSSFDLPVLIMHGEADGLTEPEGSQNFYAECASEDKEIVIWPGGYHELTRDLAKDQVLSKMTEWMDARIE